MSFSRLPTELRLQIWEKTIEPRIVDVRMKESQSTPKGAFLISKTPAPAILRVCRESRGIGLGAYQKAFSEIARPGKSWAVPHIWVNFNIDIIDIGTSLLENYKPVAEQILRLRLEREESAEGWYHWEVRELLEFQSLKEIHVVCADGLFAWIGALEEHTWPCGEENVFFIDPVDEGRVFRGNKGLDEIADLLDVWIKEHES